MPIVAVQRVDTLDHSSASCDTSMARPFQIQRVIGRKENVITYYMGAKLLN